MRRRGRHAGRTGHGWVRRLTRALAGAPVPTGSAIVLLILAVVVLSPAGTAADAGIEALTESVPLSAAAFAGTPAVGALLEGGPHGNHFCTASVVNSPAQDVIITAAHCVSRFASDPQSITFVPGYNDGQAPHGAWTVTRIFSTPSWQSDGDQDDDVAFLTVQGPVQKYTGAETLPGSTQPGSGGAGTVVRVIGYPDGASSPVTCQNRVGMVSPTQMEFDCKSFTDGTSGGPFLTGINAVTGTGTIIGVIGGYQQGGDTPDVSYSPVFGPDVQALYRSVAGQG
jgi:V8-like Glu-specific endopeptidase